VKFTLNTIEDRKRAFRELRKLVLSDIANGRIPTFHVVHIEDGLADNHYMTPVSLEPVDDQGNRVIWIQDFEFFLKLLLKLKGTIKVEYNHERPAVIFYYIEGA
jgi:hypothetical protein